MANDSNPVLLPMQQSFRTVEALEQRIIELGGDVMQLTDAEGSELCALEAIRQITKELGGDFRELMQLPEDDALILSYLLSAIKERDHIQGITLSEGTLNLRGASEIKILQSLCSRLSPRGLKVYLTSVLGIDETTLSEAAELKVGVQESEILHREGDITITGDTLCAFMAGKTAGTDTGAIIIREKKKQGSPIQRWFEDMYKKLRNPLDIGWGRLIEKAEEE